MRWVVVLCNAEENLITGSFLIKATQSSLNRKKKKKKNQKTEKQK